MSRWKYRTATVVDGDNKQDVRQLTAGELRQFKEKSAAAKEKEIPREHEAEADEVMSFAVSMGAQNPTLSIVDVDSMPQSLRLKCFQEILALSVSNEKKELDPDEMEPPEPTAHEADQP